MEKIYHIATKTEWDTAKLFGEYYPSEPSGCPFIHCSFGHQVTEIANFLFKGRRDLIRLEIDAKKVASELKVESPEPNTEAYPHLYRKLKCDEVLAEHEFQPNTDGSFSISEKLK